MKPTSQHSPPSLGLLLIEPRSIFELTAGLISLNFTAPIRDGDGHPVFVLPGLGAGDLTTAPLRHFLTGRGYSTYGWNQGVNLGPRDGVEDTMRAKVEELFDTHGRKVSLVGWSLGGIYAREIAREMPEKIRCVISMGSPVCGDPRDTNAWRLYELLSRQSVDESKNQWSPDPLPVPSTSIYSRSDGVVAWQNCIQDNNPQSENIHVNGSHMGLGFHPEVMTIVADRLSQPEGQWKPYLPVEKDNEPVSRRSNRGAVDVHQRTAS